MYTSYWTAGPKLLGVAPLSFIAVLFALAGCAPTVTYTALGTARNPSSRNLDALAEGEILYSLPTTRLTLKPGSAKEEECAKAAIKCWNGAAFIRSSFVADDAVVYRVSPGGLSLFYGKTDLSSSLYDDNEPRLPKSVSVIYTNTGKNIAVAGGAAFVSLAGFGVPFAVGGALFAAIAATGVGGGEKAFNLSQNSISPVPSSLICTASSGKSDRTTYEGGMAAVPKIPTLPPDGAIINIERLSIETKGGCWSLLRNPKERYSPSESAEFSGWLFRVIRLENSSTLPLFAQEPLDSFVRKNQTGKMFPVVACINVKVEVAWWQVPRKPATTDNPFDIPRLQGEIFKVASPPFRQDDLTSSDGIVVSPEIRPLALPKNGQIAVGEFCGGSTSLTATSLSHDTSDTLNAVIKAIGDSKDKEKKN
ncbi:hypothetical protein [Caballeronia sp. KNU42]